jgi:hypothetical protein
MKMVNIKKVILVSLILTVLYFNINFSEAASYVCTQPFGKQCPPSQILPGGEGSVDYVFQYASGIDYGFCSVSREHICGIASSYETYKDPADDCEIAGLFANYAFSGSTIGGSPGCTAYDPTYSTPLICATTHTSKSPFAVPGWRIPGTLLQEVPTIQSGSFNECNDGKDNDCDGTCDTSGCNGLPADPSCISCSDNDADGYSDTGGATCGAVDCNDTNSSIHPGAVEICNDEVDNDCVNGPDINSTGQNVCSSCTNNDGDGYYANGGTCGAVDCNDNNASIYPGAPEVCYDEIDNNCDGLIDEGCPPRPCQILNAYWTPAGPVQNGTTVILKMDTLSCNSSHLFAYAIYEDDDGIVGLATGDDLIRSTGAYFGSPVTWESVWTYTANMYSAGYPQNNDDDPGQNNTYFFRVIQTSNTSNFKFSNFLIVKNLTNTCVQDNGGVVCNIGDLCSGSVVNADDIDSSSQLCCAGGSCCTPQSKAVTCGSNNCGQTTNNCGQIISCGNCASASGYSCNGDPGVCVVDSTPECKVKSVSWDRASTTDGTNVTIYVNTTDCPNQINGVFITILEDDVGGDIGYAPLPDDLPPSNFLIGDLVNNFSAITWTAQWMDDSDGEEDPEYYFEAVPPGAENSMTSKDTINPGQYHLLSVSLPAVPPAFCTGITTCASYEDRASCVNNVCESSNDIINNSRGSVICGDRQMCIDDPNLDSYNSCGCVWSGSETSGSCGFRYLGLLCNASSPYSCGNGVVEPGEECDWQGPNLGGKDCSVFNLQGTPTCTFSCKLNSSSCTGFSNVSCGDGILDTGEECDVPEYNNKTCMTLGHDWGPLTCDNCRINSSSCIDEDSIPGVGYCTTNTNDAKECGETPDPGYYIAYWDALFNWIQPGWSTNASCLANFSATSGCINMSGTWYYDPDGLRSSCPTSGENRILCPTDIKLPFFGFYQAIITLGVVFILYFLIRVDGKKKE